MSVELSDAGVMGDVPSFGAVEGRCDDRAKYVPTGLFLTNGDAELGLVRGEPPFCSPAAARWSNARALCFTEVIFIGIAVYVDAGRDSVLLDAAPFNASSIVLAWQAWPERRTYMAGYPCVTPQGWGSMRRS